VIETFLSKCAIATNPTSPPVMPQYTKTPPTCYNCGVIGHTANQCANKGDNIGNPLPVSQRRLFSDGITDWI